MSTSNPHPHPPAPPTAAPVQTAAIVPLSAPVTRRLVIVSHSSLFYWWPVWAIAFLFAIISYFGDAMATVPHGTKVKERVTVPGLEGPRTVLVFPKDARDSDDLKDPFIHISHSKNVGVVFLSVLLMVILITNIPLRGVWSFVVILIVFFVVVILAILDKWKVIFQYLDFLDIRINAAGYLVFASLLCALWLIVFFLFDQQIYMIFEPGQMRVRQSIGDAEMSFDTTGMTTQKQRSDLFRHWILGLGSGDLIVKTSGAHPQDIYMNNVLFVGRKHREIEELLRSREVVSGNNS